MISELYHPNGIERFTKVTASVPIFNVVRPTLETLERIGVDPNLTGVYLAGKSIDGLNPSLFYLTPKEFEFVQNICTAPLSSKEIAVAYEMSAQTVKHHISKIFRKYNIHLPYRKQVTSKESLNARMLELGILEYRPSVDVYNLQDPSNGGNPILYSLLKKLEGKEISEPDMDRWSEGGKANFRVLKQIRDIGEAFQFNEVVRRRVTELVMQRSWTTATFEGVLQEIKADKPLSEIDVNTFFAFRELPPAEIDT